MASPLELFLAEIANVSAYSSGALDLARSEGVDILRKKFFANARAAEAVANTEAALWLDLCEVLQQRKRFAKQSEWLAARERLERSAEATAMLATYIEAAYREPLEPRRRMIEHAVGGLMDISLEIDDLMRVWNALQRLAPMDVQALYGLWLVPNKTLRPVAFGRNSPGSFRAKLVSKHADSLEPAGAVKLRDVGEGFGSGGSHQEIEITSTGKLLLTALRSFLRVHQVPFPIPGHASQPGSRTEDDARKELDKFEPLRVLRKYANGRFSFMISYDCPLDADAPARGRAQLVFRDIAVDALAALPSAQPRNTPLCQPVDELWLERVTAGEVQLHGPHDVLKHEAYSVFAAW